MNKTETKQLIIAVVILGIFVSIICAITLFNNHKTNQYIIIGKEVILEKKSNQWRQLEEVNDEIFKQKYTVDTGEKKYKNATVNYASNTWYYVDKDFNNIDSNKVRIAYNKIDNIKLADYIWEMADETDLDILTYALEDENIKNINSFLVNTRKVIIDLDNDGNDESIYTTTNASLSYDGEPQLSKMFVVKDGEIIQTINADKNEPFFIMEILDLDGDGKYEMIVNKGDIDIKKFDSCYQIYKINKDKIKIEKDCSQKNK